MEYRYTLHRIAMLIGILLVGLIPGCRRENPQVQVRVTVDRAQILPGQVLEMKYRFQTDPDFRAIPYRGTVFVHFIDPLDTLQFTDDHPPPKDTTAWQPGETIEYTRYVIIPDFLYPGTYRIEIGIYDPNGQHSRVPLRGGKEITRRSYEVAQIEVLPPPPFPQVQFREGWYDLEANPVDPVQRWRWTQKHAVVELVNPKRAARLFLKMEGNLKAFQDSPQQVTLRLNGAELETFTIDRPEPFIRMYALTPEQLGTEDYVRLEIEVDKTFVPAKLGMGQDTRELGVRVYHVVLQAIR